jgi:hypothetical protein
VLRYTRSVRFEESLRLYRGIEDKLDTYYLKKMLNFSVHKLLGSIIEIE